MKILDILKDTIPQEDNRIYHLKVRTNRHVKWQYAEYGGRYESMEKAIASAKNHMGDKGFEYKIWNMVTDEEVIGFINWNK